MTTKKRIIKKKKEERKERKKWYLCVVHKYVEQERGWEAHGNWLMTFLMNQTHSPIRTIMNIKRTKNKKRETCKVIPKKSSSLSVATLFFKY